MSASRWLSILWIVSVLSSCTSAPTVPVSTQELHQPSPLAKYNAEIETIDCPFQLPADVDPAWVQCKNLVVPEDRSQTQGRKIKIAYLILRTPSSAPKTDPLLILYTTPSQQMDISLSFAYALGSELFRTRDAVVIDVRGVGFSDPSFTCPELNTLYTEALEASPIDDLMPTRWLETEQDCYQSWVSKGYDMQRYGTVDIAADLEDLRQVEGYQQWNIIGVGYGSRLAYSLARDYPQTVRSMVLDAPEPVNGDLYTLQAQNRERVLNQILDGCTSDSTCNKAFPHIKQSFYQLMDDLDNKPVQVEVTNLQNGLRYLMWVNGDRFLNAVLEAIAYQGRQFIPELPRMITQVKNGQYYKLAEILGSRISANEPSSVVMQNRINCLERVFAIPSSEVINANRVVEPRIANSYNEDYQSYERTCHQIFKDLYTGTQNLTALTSSGNIPALLLLGDQNSFVSPDWARAVTVSLKNTTYLEISHQGVNDWLFNPISATGKSCITPIVNAFIQDPATIPPTECAAKRHPVLWITFQ
jgi:pimeloyl-ACP methyl ester carboxylesterase